MAKLTFTMEDFQNTVFIRTSLQEAHKGPLTQAQKLGYGVLQSLQAAGVQVMTEGETLPVHNEGNVIDFFSAFRNKKR